MLDQNTPIIKRTLTVLWNTLKDAFKVKGVRKEGKETKRGIL